MTQALPKPLNNASYSDESQLFNAAYDVFQLELNWRDKRPLLFGKFIYIDASQRYADGRINGFWHIASLGEDDTKYDMYPCNNDKTNELCKYICNVDHPDNFMKDDNSIPCIYRASRVNWIKCIIELADNNRKHPNLRIWTQTNKRTREKDLLIRYIEGSHIDYIIIFRISYKKRDIDCYRLKTAFPVVLKSYKKAFDAEYDQFLKSQKK